MKKLTLKVLKKLEMTYIALAFNKLALYFSFFKKKFPTV